MPDNTKAPTPQIKTIDINGQTWRYVGEPLEAFIFNGNAWEGRSNLVSDEDLIEIQLDGLTDCFYWMDKWMTEISAFFGYILDFANKVVYYDDDEALDYLKLKVFPSQNLENYFEELVKEEFIEV